jgi:hypothetical protein
MISVCCNGFGSLADVADALLDERRELAKRATTQVVE